MPGKANTQSAYPFLFFFFLERNDMAYIFQYFGTLWKTTNTNKNMIETSRKRYQSTIQCILYLQ